MRSVKLISLVLWLAAAAWSQCKPVPNPFEPGKLMCAPGATSSGGGTRRVYATFCSGGSGVSSLQQAATTLFLPICYSDPFGVLRLPANSTAGDSTTVWFSDTLAASVASITWKVVLQSTDTTPVKVDGWYVCTDPNTAVATAPTYVSAFAQQTYTPGTSGKLSITTTITGCQAGNTYRAKLRIDNHTTPTTQPLDIAWMEVLEQ